MLRNWLLVAFRNLRKHATSSTINIFGLTVGLSSCLLIALYIRHELSYDDFETKGGRVARVIMEYRFAGGDKGSKGNYTSTHVAPRFQQNFPEIELAVRMYEGGPVVGYREKLFRENHFMYADSSFFGVFDMPLMEGDPQTALSGLHKVVVTQSTAARYFGKEDPVGKMLLVGTDSVLYQVTGVMRDCPSNSQIKFDLLASFSSLKANDNPSYWDANYTTFLLLRNSSSFEPLQAKIHTFMKKEMAGTGAVVDFWLEPFRRIHLYSEYAGFEPGTPILYLYVLGLVALLILVIACSTYINLSTARSVERAREVGIRKVIGAGQGQLFRQFIGESSFLCLLSVVLSLGVAALALPAFNRLADRSLPPASLFSPSFIAIAFGIAAMVSLLAGSYPALVLSRFQPVKVLKGAFKNTRSGRGLRLSLIVFQFVISVFLIVCTLVMQGQLSYIRHKNLGYDRDQVLVLPMSWSMLSRIDYFKTQLRQNPDVLRISHAASTPVTIMGGYNMRSSTMPSSQYMNVRANPIDEDYLRTTGIQLVAGEDITFQDMRDANPDFYPPAPGSGKGSSGTGGSGGSGDAGGGSGGSGGEPRRFLRFILNESAARALGWSPQEAVGKRMFLDDSRPGIVKGVVRDFHFDDMHHAIQPLVLFPEMRARTLMAKISGKHIPQTIAFLEAKYKELEPSIPFEYRFLDEDYNQLYHSDIRLGQLMNIFSLIAIVLACLGLFGLSSYAARQRVKEIGIRKVLGASMPNLVMLMSSGFVRMAAVAILIAFPLSWWAMSKWLEDFVYRRSMDWGAYALAGLLVMAIALGTVSIEAFRTARMNPVKNLKVE